MPLVCVSLWTICIIVCFHKFCHQCVCFHKFCYQGVGSDKCCCPCVFVCLVISGPFLPVLSSVFVLAAGSVFTSSVVGVCFHMFCLSVCFRKFCCLCMFPQLLSSVYAFASSVVSVCFHIGCQCFHKPVCKFPMVLSPACVFLKLFRQRVFSEVLPSVCMFRHQLYVST